MKIQRRGAHEVLAIGVTEPSDFGSVDIDRLKADSKYDLWCSLEGHRKAGMEATLKVKKKQDKKYAPSRAPPRHPRGRDNPGRAGSITTSIWS